MPGRNRIGRTATTGPHVKTSGPTPSASAPTAKPPRGGAERAAPGHRPPPKAHGFRAILAESRGIGPSPHPPAAAAASPGAGPVEAPRPRRGSPDEPPERDPEPRLPPQRLPEGALREPGPASFGASAASPVPLPSSVGAAAIDPAALVAVAERVLRSLRVGTDAQGRSLVQLDVADGPLGGCRVELRRVAGGVAVEVRDPAGAPDPRELIVVDALRRRGIEVV